VLTPEAYFKLEELVRKELGTNMKMYNRMIPFAAISMLINKSIAGKEDDRIVAQEDRGPGIPQDLFLLEKAKKYKLKTTGIESVEEQMNAIDFYNSSEFIIEFCDSYYEEQNTVIQLIEHYLEADLDNIYELIYKQKHVPEEEREVLFDKRNKIFADRIDTMIQNTPTLVAFGAGHLMGEPGVIQLLEDKGYELKPVIAGKSKWADDETKADEITKEWVEIQVEDIFTVLLPEKVTPVTQEVPTDTGMAEMTMIMYNPMDGKGVTCNIMIINMGKTITYTREQLDSFYLKIQHSTVTTMGGRVLEEKGFMVQGLIGKEATVLYMNGMYLMIQRLLLVRNKLAIIQAIGTRDGFDKEQAYYFLESIKTKK
jgi:hypothetical protein